MNSQTTIYCNINTGKVFQVLLSKKKIDTGYVKTDGGIFKGREIIRYVNKDDIFKGK